MSEGARRQLSSSAVAPPSMQQQPCERIHCVALPQVMGYASAAIAHVGAWPNVFVLPLQSKQYRQMFEQLASIETLL